MTQLKHTAPVAQQATAEQTATGPAAPQRANATRRRALGWSAALVASATGVVAAACGQAAPGAGTAQSGTPGASGTASVQGRLQVVQVLDFHPDHNAFIKKTIQDYAAQRGWELDLSDLAGFLGSSDIYQKLQAQKAAGQPVDLIFHGLSARRLALFDLTHDATPLVNKMVERYGKPYSSARASHMVDGKWVGLPFYDRVGGYWVREDAMKQAGIDNVDTQLSRWEGVLDAARKVSKPESNFYGWGMTVNRSGDGESVVWGVIQAWGGALADSTGQVVTLDSKETVDAVRWLSAIYTDPANRGLTPPGVNAWNDTSNNEAYLAGQVGITSNAGTLYAKAVLDKNPVAEGTTLIQAPRGPAGVHLQGSGGHYFYFMNGSRNFDAAATVAEHLLTDEVQHELWRISQGYVVPAYEKRWEHALIKDNRISSKFKQIAFNEPPFSGLAWRGPITEASDAVSAENVATDMMGEVLAGKPVEQAVRDAHQRAVGIFQSFGMKGR